MPKELLFDRAPHLRDEWDYTKNTRDPEKMTAGVGDKVWWKCVEGHGWSARPSSRVAGRGCPQCNKNKVHPLSKVPALVNEFDDDRYTPDELGRGSVIKVWWRCASGHRWACSVASRYAGSGCPYCSGRLPIRGETDLATLRPDLVAQWDDEKDPTEFTVRSRVKIQWKCAEGHRWDTGIHNRTDSRTKGGGCPYCSKGRYRRIEIGVNDLASVEPEIAKELHTEGVHAAEIFVYSNKKFEWRCSEGHTWVAQVSSRTAQHRTGCPECSLKSTSKIEGRLRDLIDSNRSFSNTVLEKNHKIPVPWRKNKNMSVDISCMWRGKPLVIEYDGSFWHDKPSSIARDMDKTNAMLLNGYLVVRIRENSLPFLDIQSPNLLQVDTKYSLEDDNLENALSEIERWLEEIHT